MEHQNLSPLKKIVRISFLSLLFLSFTQSVFAVNYNVSGYTSIGSQGEININGNGGDTVIVGVPSGSRAFIQAIPASGYTFSSWSDSFAGQSSMINTVVTGTLSGTASFISAPSAIMSINNKCVSRIVTYTTSNTNPLGGISSNATKVQIYILEGSSFSSPVQDVSGYLAQSPNQAFYYAYNASTVGAGTYLGSNTAFVGATTYISLGSATVTSDVNYSCVSVPVSRYSVVFSSNLPNNIASSANLVGNGTYNNHSNVVLKASAVTGYKLSSIDGRCGTGSTGYDGTGLNNYAFSIPFSQNQLTYQYTLTDIQNNCFATANYVYVPPVNNLTYHVRITTGIDGSNLSTVTLNAGSYGSCTSSICDVDVPAGTYVTVSATPYTGYTFSNWSDDLYNKGTPYTFPVTKDFFGLAQFSLNSTTASTTVVHQQAPLLTMDALPNNGAGYITVANTALSFPRTWGTCNNVGSSCYLYYFEDDYVTIPVPQPNAGYVFQGWTGNLAPSTMTKVNSGTPFKAGEMVGITSPTIHANFIFNGQVDSGDVTVAGTPEVIASSPVGLLDTSLQDYGINGNGSFDPSPYFIDGKCVNRIIQFRGRRYKFNLGDVHLWGQDRYVYTLYGLEGSTVSADKSGNNYTFKSDPSSWILRATASSTIDMIPAGQYSSTSTASQFVGIDHTYTFYDFELLGKVTEYSCSAQDVASASVAPRYIGVRGSSPMIQGISFEGDFFNNTLVNLKGDITATSSFLTSRGYDRSSLNSAYQRLKCEEGTISTRTGLYCASWLSDEQMTNWNDYRFMWVFSTSPIKGFYHQQYDYTVLNEPPMGLVYFPAVYSKLIKGSSTIDVTNITDVEMGRIATTDTGYLSRDDVPFYATKIDLTKCRWFSYPHKIITSNPTDCRSAYGDSVIATSTVNYVASLNNGSAFTTLDFANNTGLYITDKQRLNGLMLNTSAGFTGDVLYYGALLTSDNTFAVYEGSDAHTLLAKRVQRGVSNPQDYLNQVLSGYVDTVTVTATSSVYVATSTVTVNGYYDEPVYHATTTDWTTILNATNTIAWIPFASSTQDYTGNRTLTTQNGTSFCTTYMASSSACFDGSNDYVSMSNGFNLSGINWSVEQDVYLTSVSGDRAVIDQSDGSTNSGSSYHFEVSGGYMKLWLMYGSTSSTFSGTYALSANTLYKLRYTYDGSNIRFYVNNSLKDTWSFSQTINNTGTPSIGSLAGSYWFTSGGVRNVYIANIATTTPFPLMSTVYTTINGYYDEPVYHATTTTTTNGHFTTATSTFDYDLSNDDAFGYSSVFNGRGLYKFTNDSFSVDDSLSYGFASFTQLKSQLLGDYDIQVCIAKGYWGPLFSYVICSITSGIPTIIISLIVPSANQMQSFATGLQNLINSGTGIFSTLFSIPMRFDYYSDLSWSPATSTQLTLGFSTSSKIAFVPPTTSQSLVFTASDKKIANFIAPFLQIILVVIVGIMTISIFV